jgi:hypothetical protein
LITDKERKGLEDKFKVEIDSAIEGSDLHWLIRKIAEEISGRVPANDDLKNWKIAKEALLFYSHVQICSNNLRKDDSLADYLTREFNLKAYEKSNGKYGEIYWIEAQKDIAKGVVDLISAF